ncbi:MAG TPA: hypothetical protein VHX42_04370 [Candidatus Babeliales bacterium]|jgi:hypothetical protein|nr:hypothetical protein [Candidatus Babeliales bacterium]
MKNISNFVIIAACITFTHSTFGMHIQRSTTKKLLYKRYYDYTLSSRISGKDIQKGRRDAYQKWCPQQIHWSDTIIDTTYTLQLSNHNFAHNNQLGYWRQFIKE